MKNQKRDFISVADFSQKEIWDLLLLARKLKKKKFHPVLKGKSIGLIFEKPSTRTAVSFAVGVNQLGGQPLILNAQILQMKRGESPKDTGRVLSRYLDGIVIRAHKHDEVLEMAKNAEVPVINGLTEKEHPCQVLADVMTILEHWDWPSQKELRSLNVTYLGDGNNMAHSWMLMAAILGFNFRVASPEKYQPLNEYKEWAAKLNKKPFARIEISTDPEKAAEGADVLYTDVWASMGQEEESEERRKIFAPYQLNADLLARAKEGALVMHCLPAHRGEEITDDIIEGPNSVVFDQAENRLHVQKAILLTLLKK